MSVCFMSKFPVGVPENATPINFKYGRGMDGTYYVWPTKGGKWQWQAFDNSGEANSHEQAISQAREYIMNDYDPLNHN